MLRMMILNLKSNMDRFIDMKIIKVLTMIINLKSNMDRFIVLAIVFFILKSFVFKIQYG